MVYQSQNLNFLKFDFPDLYEIGSYCELYYLIERKT